MNWQGDIRWSAKVGAPVKLGAVVVPKRVTMTGVGQASHPDFRYEFEMSRDGEARCIEASVSAKPSGRGIRAADVAQIGIDQLTVVAFQAFAQDVVRETDTMMATMRTRKTHGRAEWPAKAAVSAGQGTTAHELLDVATVYAEAKKAPIRAVETKLGYQRRTAARRIADAREAGLLPAKDQPITAEVLERIEVERARLSGPKQPSQDEVRSALRARGHEV